MNRSRMSSEERSSRSKIKPYLENRGLVRGTLNERMRVCGNANCKCTRGERHRALFLVRSKDGKVEQLYIPREKEETVRQWVKNWKAVQANLEEISSSYWDRLKRKD